MRAETLPTPEIDSRSIQYVAFDFDGTLADTMGEASEIFANSLERDFGIPFRIATKYFIDTLGTPTHSQLDDLLKSFNIYISFEELLTIARTIDSRMAQAPAQLFPEVKEVLEELTYYNSF